MSDIKVKECKNCRYFVFLENRTDAKIGLCQTLQRPVQAKESCDDYFKSKYED